MADIVRLAGNNETANPTTTTTTTTASITFGQLFDDERVTQQYEALVGTLLMAKKRQWLDFPGEMLLKGTHDNVVITLTKQGVQQVSDATKNHTTTSRGEDIHIPSSTTSPPPSFLETYPAAMRQDTTDRLDAFLITHVPHRPLALVTGGGTSVDLDTVRSLENFSTGWRSAVAVEHLLRAGYAVVHLQRRGASATPFARILVEECSGSTAAAHASLTLETMDRLLGRGGNIEDGNNDDDDEYRPTFHAAQDPWMTDPEHSVAASSIPMSNDVDKTASELHLRRALVHSSRLQKAVRERYATRGRLLTILFTTVQEYLALLELCSTALQATAGAQALMLLAAAVSDFYVANPQQHKIQSDSVSDKFVLELEPVPKTLGILRRSWAPDAFCVSFKLETDETILQRKAQRAMDKYGVHMVVGNILQTRYDQVHLLLSKDEWVTLDKPSGGNDNGKEALEELLLQAVVEAHFAHMSGHGPPTLSAALQQKSKRLQRQHWWQRGKQLFWEVTGVTVSLLLSYGINRLVLRQSSSRVRVCYHSYGIIRLYKSRVRMTTTSWQDPRSFWITSKELTTFAAHRTTSGQSALDTTGVAMSRLFLLSIYDESPNGNHVVLAQPNPTLKELEEKAGDLIVSSQTSFKDLNQRETSFTPPPRNVQIPYKKSAKKLPRRKAM
eukprot:scaffold34604_cov164-Amphora_coffeaeformis.AAC.17